MPAATTLQPDQLGVENCRPWYETSVDPHESAPLSPTPDTNLYSCALCINVPPQEVSRLRPLYAPLLQWIDPMFQLVRVEEKSQKDLVTRWYNKTTDHEHLNGFHYPGLTDWNEPRTGLVTQALSVILFLRDDSQSQLTASGAEKYLQTPPWRLHHKIELTSRVDLRVVARQVFYASSHDHELPLWSVCSIHCGSEQLRFNIFVKDFEGMKDFYRALLNRDVCAMKPGFCLFQIYSQPGLEIQLSLKHSPCLLPERTKAAVLSFKVQNISHLQKALPYKVMKHTSDTWRTRDVDGNMVLLSRDTSQYNDSHIPQVV